MAAASWITEIILFIIKVLLFMYDILSLPFYFFAHRPWHTWKNQKKIWAQLEDKSDPYSSYIRQDTKAKFTNADDEPLTMNESFNESVAKFGNSPCYGVREVLREEEETSKSGKVFKKLILGDYKWISYNDANERIDNIGKGLLSLGVKSQIPIVIFAETRQEWALTAQACLRINVPVVTLYATLGEEGIVHSLNETEVKCMVTSADLIQKVEEILPQVPNITNVIYMEGRKEITTQNIAKNVTVTPFSELEEMGSKTNGLSFTPPSLQDLAIIMYTSGSTGVPKGVMMTHRNLAICLKGLERILCSGSSSLLTKDDIYIAYLPIAHILELATECLMSTFGVRIGFSSPHTLTDFSTGIKRGEIGDLKALKPTLLAAVPLMLDRIRNSILHLAGADGTLSRKLFNFAISYKTSWEQKGFLTPLLNRFALQTYKDFMGGHLRFVVCGGAPLSPDTQLFIRACLSVRLAQGYGLTETSSCNTIADFDDLSYGTVGAPLSTCKLKLVDWKEGLYHVKDKPNPRGEIVIGGGCVSMGYFKNAELSQESFKIEGGDRWFFTGDIGEVLPNGLLKIIDRKKDLVKLQFGEYIPLGKVEAELKTCPVVDNICVFGNGFHNYTIALVTPNASQLKAIAKGIYKEDLSLSDMCSNPVITQEVSKIIKEHAEKCHLFGSEVPRKFKLCSEEWTPESGLVTAAFKIRRKCIESYYQSIIDTLYSDNNPSKTLS